MTKEYKELALSYLNNSTFIIALIEYIKSRDDYPLFKNLYKLIKTNIDASSVDFNKIKNMYNELFNINDVIYYPKNLPVFKYLRDIKIKNLEMISPFDVPINYIYGEEMDCSVEGGIVPYNNKNFRYVRKLNLTLTKAVLESYAHEIAHTQQTFMSGVNNEMIPIFMEIIARDCFNNKLSVREFLNRNDIKEDNYKNLSLIRQYFK